MTRAIGVDVGGSSIKIGVVNFSAKSNAATTTSNTPELLHRLSVASPPRGNPEEFLDQIHRALERLDKTFSNLPIGVALPAVVKLGTTLTASNIGEHWVGYPVVEQFAKRLGKPVIALNDADAAGIAEIKYGAGRLTSQHGTTIVTTLGTGIGSALFWQGELIPNVELGYLTGPQGPVIERWAAASVRTLENLSWQDWAARIQVFYSLVERVFSPDLMIVGGGVSAESDKFLPLLDLKTPIVAAKYLNDAGIIGAAHRAVFG